MTTQELLKKVRKIEIKTKGLSNQIFAGEYHSAFKGRGMTFSEVRGYAHGDEIRTIDWNVTARFNEPYVKVFEEEREMTVMLLIDISASENYGTLAQSKKDIIAELCAVISFSAISNNDKIGALFFTSENELFIPPKKGKKHILRIIREVIHFKPKHKGTNIAGALSYFSNMVKKKSIAFVLSDFYDKGYDQAIKVANNRHDIIGLKISDHSEKELPKVGYLPLCDAETGKLVTVNTNKKSVREAYRKKRLDFDVTTKHTLRKAGVDFADIETDKDYIPVLMKLFKRRMSR